MEALIEYIAKALVDEPEAVAVRDVGDNILELKVAEDDRGRVIGRKGRTAHAIRVLLTAATKDGPPPQLEIVD